MFMDRFQDVALLSNSILLEKVGKDVVTSLSFKLSIFQPPAFESKKSKKIYLV